LSPEKDPEYRNVIKPSLLQPLVSSDSAKLNAAIQLPIPKDGDVVGILISSPAFTLSYIFYYIFFFLFLFLPDNYNVGKVYEWLEQ
jgi:hypothetical protein